MVCAEYKEIPLEESKLNIFSFFHSTRQQKFKALVGALIPRSLHFGVAQWNMSFLILEDFLAEQPFFVRIKLALFLKLIDGLSFLKTGKIFFRLSSDKQAGLLCFFFDSSIPLLRKGFWGLNTLAKMAVFGQPSVYGKIGYEKKGL